MIQTGLVYIHFTQEASGFAGCATLVEGPFVVTCRHVWDVARQKAGDAPVWVHFPPPEGIGESVFSEAKLVCDCQTAEEKPDLVVLEADIPGPHKTLELLRDKAAEAGAAYALVGLDRRAGPSETVQEVLVAGEIVGRIDSYGMRQFAGVPSRGYWSDQGSSGSPVCLKERTELAGMLRLSETGARPGEAPIHAAFVIPATTIHRHLRRHVGLEIGREHGVDAATMEKILRVIGAGTCSIAEIRDRLREYFASVPKHAAQPTPATNAGRDVVATITEAKALSAAHESDRASAVLGHLRRHVGIEIGREHGVDAATMEKILRVIGAGTCSIAEIRDRLRAYFASVPKHAAQPTPATNAGRDVVATITEVKALSAAHESDRASAILGRAIAAKREAIQPGLGDLVLLLKEQAAQQRLRFDHDGAAATLREIVRYDPDTALSWLELGDIQVLRGERAAAQQSFRAGRDAAERTGDDRSLIVCHRKLGEILLAGGARDEALAAFRAAEAAARALTARDPENGDWQYELAYSHRRIGELLLKAGERHAAQDAFRAGHAIAAGLAARDPSNGEWQRVHAVSYSTIGDVLLLDGDRAGALAEFRAALAISQTLAARDPGYTEWQRDLSISHDRIGDVLLLDGDRAGALAEFRAALAIRQTLTARDPGHTEWQRDLAISHYRIGDVLLLDGDRAGALAEFRAALAIHQTLAARDPGHTEWQRDLSVSHERIGDVLLLDGDRAGALAEFRAALAIRQTLAARDPGYAEWQRDLSISHQRIGDLLLLDGDRNGALGEFSAGLDIARDLAARGKLAPGDTLVAYLEWRVASM